MPTGRKDGRVSLASDTTNLPGFRDSIDVQKQKFSAKGLNAQDLVTLVGKDQCIKSFNKSFSSKYLTWLIYISTKSIIHLCHD